MYDYLVVGAFIIKHLPMRMVFDNNYFNDEYQGIPIGGYTQIIKKMLKDIEVYLDTNFFEHRDEFSCCANKILFTGMIDAYYDYCYGELEYRSLHFETDILPIENYQGNAVINFTEFEIPYTRIIEHKHFEFSCQGGAQTSHTVVTHEYPAVWKHEDEPYYPINDYKNNQLYMQYKALADSEKKVIFGGRLAMYKYLDMNDIIGEALKCVK